MSILSSVLENDQMERILTEFTRLGDRTYLEHAGATLYPQCLLKQVNKDLLENVYMNPHTDKFTKDCVDHIRCMVLKYFNTNPSEYTVIFTSGATQSLRTVVESFQFANNDTDRCGSFVYLRDNHTSVLGLRELVEDKANVIHITHEEFLGSLARSKSARPEKTNSDRNSLFAYPAQNNFNGYKYPIHLMENIRNGCLDCFARQHLCEINCNWYILLDVASYVPTNKLDLSLIQPDYVCLSFYKVFGYPSGLGALIVKNSSRHMLSKKKYFGGGTVDFVLSSEDFHVKRSSLQERFEDGTIPFLSIIALKHCFDVMEKLIPKIIDNSIMQTISYHTFYLAKDLYTHLKSLRHRNGNKAVVLYMDSDFSNINEQGSIVTFNLLRDDGDYIGYVEFQHMADLFNINVRTGCFCNSGSCQRHIGASNKAMKDSYKAGHKCGDEIDLIEGKPTGAIRVSFGYFNTYNDVDKLLSMICRCFVRTTIKKHKRVPLIKNAYVEHMKLSKKLSNELTKYVKEHQIISDYQKTTESKKKFRISNTRIVLTEIAIFPIKSCGAFKVTKQWKLGTKGFEYDREWMILRDNGVCLTQKQNNRMCLIRPYIDLEKRVMTLTFKGKSSIDVPLDPQPLYNNTEATFCRSKICMDTVLGEDCGDEVADWISEALEVSFLRLFRQSRNDDRKQKRKPDKDQTDYKLSLSNQAQYLLINKATVRWLKRKIQDDTFNESINKLVDRFRANLVIDMEEPLEEKKWQSVIIGMHEFKVEGQCSRCQMVCIDQSTGDKTVEPLRTISSQFSGKLQFGIYLSYVGNIEIPKDQIITVYSTLKPIFDDENISR